MALKRSFALLVSTACLLLGVPALQAGAAPDHEPLPVLRPDRHGALIGTEDVTFPADASVHARKVAFSSRDTQDRPIVATGLVLVPAGEWEGRGQRPLVAYDVGTHGLADRCAPSHTMTEGDDVEATAVAALLRMDFAVVVPDYEGLGTPGPHTYMNRAAQAHVVLDAVSAAQRLDGVPRNGPVGLVGYSQGGGATAAAAELQREYAPRLKLTAAAAGAPPADLAATGEFLDGTRYAAFMLYGVAGIAAAYPDRIDLAGTLSAEGEAVLAQIVDECTTASVMRHAFTDSTTLTEDGRPLSEYLAEAPYDALLDEQLIGRRAPAVPILVAHGERDDVVPYEQGRVMAASWCDLGADVEFRTLAGSGHVGAAPEFFAGAFAWLGERFAENPRERRLFEGNCGQF